MVFVRKVLAPGPGTGPKATFRWRSFQSALSGSRFFIPPPLVEVMILYSKNPLPLAGWEEGGERGGDKLGSRWSLNGWAFRLFARIAQSISERNN